MTTRVGALLIHGLGGTQFDLGSMHRRLKRCGVETHALTLPGHGATPEALVSIHAHEWIDAVTEKYRELIDQYDTLHVMGMCMGALLAAAVCAREQHIKGRLVTLAPPIFIDGWSTPWYREARHIAYYLPFLSSKLKIEEGEPYGIKNELVRNIVKAKFARGDNFHYRWVPLACIREVDRLRRQVMRDLMLIRCPTLVVHAREDELTSLKSAEFIQDRVRDVRVVVLENSYHMICVDNDREQVMSSVCKFLELTPQASSAPAIVNPCTPDEIRSLVDRFTSGMLEQRYEDVFPLFAADVRWNQGGQSPLARTYADRNALIDLFSQFVTLSSGTFRVTDFGEPIVDGAAGRVRIRIASQAEAVGTKLEASGTLTLAFGNGRVRTVDYVSDCPLDEDAFWSTAAAHSDKHRRDGTRQAPDGPLTDDRELDVAFKAAISHVSSISDPLAPSIKLSLWALYKQAMFGDVTGSRPSIRDIVARAKHDAWAELQGTSSEDAMRRYIAFAQRLGS
ncbi:acyl-CoA-binding protein [Burkholderia sp. BCC0405]|uniref:acyl-CoA-binding protein n=1 Tax=Burkholderia sp. BCC0405 TaxID=2676298 RepID=UPI001ABB4FB7|nr:acyl-CoA-binding protein [Burkholderia sp. BCC0405]